MRLALIIALLPSLAGAQAPIACGPRNELPAHLEEGWGETRQSVAYGTNRTSGEIVAVIETWANPESGTWTTTLTTPDGTACAILHGIGWEAVKEPEGDPA